MTQSENKLVGYISILSALDDALRWWGHEQTPLHRETCKCFSPFAMNLTSKGQFLGALCLCINIMHYSLWTINPTLCYLVHPPRRSEVFDFKELPCICYASAPVRKVHISTRLNTKSNVDNTMIEWITTANDSYQEGFMRRLQR